MKIGIDARLYGTNHAGIGRYTEQVIKNLEEIDSQNQYFIFLQQDGYDAYRPKNPNFKKVLADFKVYGFGEQLLYPLLLKSHKFDFVHFTHFNAPLFYRQKFLVTIHDLIISHYPTSRATTLNPLLYKVKLFFYKLIIKSTAKRADKIIAVSNYTKADIVKLLKINQAKIEVVYEGVHLSKAENQNCDILEKLNIKNRFLLYVGSAYPHKNLESLILAFKQIVKSEPDLQLALVGKNNFFYQRLERYVKENAKEVEDKIIFTGYLSDDDLSCLYKKAALYVFPSLIEGFGLPPLEAQNYGLPVASSNKTCLPEILSGSAEYFDPINVSQITKTIIDLLNNLQKQEDLKIKGYENLKRFSWKDCASKICDIYSSFKKE